MGIKVRAWDQYDKKMVYDMNVIYQSYIDNEFIGPWMQFTGLKDKNGKEIYEGDVVKFNSKGNNNKFWYYIVTWSNTYAKFWYSGKRGCYNGRDISNPVSCEVIGNKFENPGILSDVKEKDSDYTEGVKDE